MSDNQHPLDVRVSGLRKSYGGLQALGGVTFCVRRGEIFGYLGPNGAGKTTTINLLCGLLGRDAGNVAICGMDVDREPVGVKQQIGVVPEESNLYPELTCRRNLEYIGELYGLRIAERRERSTELLASFGLAERAQTPFRALSRGLKRRLTVAAALMHSPGVLFLDEPTAGLDVPGSRALRSLIKTINKAGTTIFLTTHNLPEADDLCDRMLILVEGRVVAQGTAQEIREHVHSAQMISIVFCGEVTERALREACPAVRSTMNAGGTWRLEVSNVHEAVRQVLSLAERENVRIVEMHTAIGSLEDAFISILQDHSAGSGEWP